MKKRIIFTLIIISFFSCSKNKTDFENMLIDNKWVYSQNEKIEDGIIVISYMRFYDNYEYKNFYMSSNAPYEIFERKKEPQEWSYNEKDSTIVILTHKFKILSVTKDVILMQREDNFKVMLYNITDKHYDEINGLQINKDSIDIK